MITETSITRLVESHLQGREIFLVEVAVKPGNRISVYIDGDHGVTIEDCRELNHFINESLDRDAEDFDLTVSSSGADRPLKLPRQYAKNLGKWLDVVTKAGEKFSGVVLKVTPGGIELGVPQAKKPKKDQESIVAAISYADIKSAKELITFKQ